MRPTEAAQATSWSSSSAERRTVRVSPGGTLRGSRPRKRPTRWRLSAEAIGGRSATAGSRSRASTARARPPRSNQQPPAPRASAGRRAGTTSPAARRAPPRRRGGCRRRAAGARTGPGTEKPARAARARDARTSATPAAGRATRRAPGETSLPVGQREHREEAEGGEAQRLQADPDEQALDDGEDAGRRPQVEQRRSPQEPGGHVAEAPSRGGRHRPAGRRRR